jgi:DNA-binding winged helix-turn-helix (wHTH) protein
MGEQTTESYEFGRFRVKSDERVLLRGQDLVSLTPKAFDILLALLENDGRIVPKDDLMKKVWPNTFVEEGNLTQNVSLLRKALGESANGPQFIETVPRRGYRFVAPVNKTNGTNGEYLSDAAGKSVQADLPAPLPVESIQGFRTPELGTRNSKPAVFSSRIPAILLTLAVAIATAAGIIYFSARNKAGAAPTAIQSIAVLPFVEENSGGDTEFLDDEIAESLVNSLT